LHVFSEFLGGLKIDVMKGGGDSVKLEAALQEITALEEKLLEVNEENDALKLSLKVPFTAHYMSSVA
jgi:hypothetical protein